MVTLLRLLEIVEIWSLQNITSQDVVRLEILIPKYLQSLLALFQGITLKPKHHFLLHYPDIIRKVGPVSKISTERFEAKHRDLKKVANNVQTRKNIPFTLAVKWQMQFVEKCVFQKGVDDRISMSKPTFSSLDLESFQFVENINVDLKNDFYEINWYNKNGIRLNQNDIIFSTKYPDNFGSTQHIFVSHKTTDVCYIICKILNKENFNDHFRSFSVKSTDQYAFLKLNEINCRPTKVHCLQGFQLVKNVEIFDAF